MTSAELRRKVKAAQSHPGSLSRRAFDAAIEDSRWLRENATAMAELLADAADVLERNRVNSAAERKWLARFAALGEPK